MAVRHITYITPFREEAAPIALLSSVCDAGTMWIPARVDIRVGDWVILDLRAGNGELLVTALVPVVDARPVVGGWRARVSLRDEEMMGLAAYALSMRARGRITVRPVAA